MKKFLSLLFLFCCCISAYAQRSADWSRGVEVTEPRQNIYNLAPADYQETVMAGRKAALFYPVTVSDLFIPYDPLNNFFESDSGSPVRELLYKLVKVVSPFKSMDALYASLGLHHFPAQPQAETPNEFPRLTRQEMSMRMGATIHQFEDGEALTFGCAACHSSDLFGVKVLGLTNRFPRANEFFRQATDMSPYIDTFLFKQVLNTTEGERLIMARAKTAMRYVGTKKPVTLGLDTSLAQVALSLAKRKQDPYASRTKTSWILPRKNKLSKMVADSKPAVWWNVKFKNRWLSDGSIVSGNPIHTNFLWNEIGRGTDLRKLEKWMKENNGTIENLTAAVFSSKAPRYEKFFGAKSINLEKAQAGQKHFVQSCQKCHGTYEKSWDLPHAEGMLSPTELIQTTKITYHLQTPVKDVGTDPGRYLGMKEFAGELNNLAISKAIGTVVEPQKGYVPPPLEGIWARWPYFHNNSIPNLCALLTPGPKRPKQYWAGAAIDKGRDFDQECVGYPLGAKTPESWKKDADYFYDTSKEGLSNVGHDDRIFIKDGKEIYTRAQKLELIEFLKTL